MDEKKVKKALIKSKAAVEAYWLQVTRSVETKNYFHAARVLDKIESANIILGFFKQAIGDENETK